MTLAMLFTSVFPPPTAPILLRSMSFKRKLFISNFKNSLQNNPATVSAHLVDAYFTNNCKNVSTHFNKETNLLNCYCKISSSTLFILNSQATGGYEALRQLHFWLTDKIQYIKIEVTQSRYTATKINTYKFTIHKII